MSNVSKRLIIFWRSKCGLCCVDRIGYLFPLPHPLNCKPPKEFKRPPGLLSTLWGLLSTHVRANGKHTHRFAVVNTNPWSDRSLGVLKFLARSISSPPSVKDALKLMFPWAAHLYMATQLYILESPERWKHVKSERKGQAAKKKDEKGPTLPSFAKMLRSSRLVSFLFFTSSTKVASRARLRNRPSTRGLRACWVESEALKPLNTCHTVPHHPHCHTLQDESDESS